MPPPKRVADISITDSEVRAVILERRGEAALSPDAIARAITFAIEQPDDAEIGSILESRRLRPETRGS